MEIDNTTPVKRPTFLTVLCILTFITTGFGLLSGIAGVFGGAPSEEDKINSSIQMNQSIEQLQKAKLDGLVHFMKQLQAMTESVYANFFAYNLVNVLILAIGLASALFMFNGKRNGFYGYLGYSLLGVILPYFFISAANIPAILPIFQTIISLIFIFMYSRNLHWMK